MYLDGHLTYNKVIDTNPFKNRLFGRECWANGLIIWRKRHPDPHLTSRSKVDCGRIQGSLCPFGLFGFRRGTQERTPCQEMGGQINSSEPPGT